MPLYTQTHRQGKLDGRIDSLNQMLASCILCPRRCGVNRLKGEVGFCKAGKDARIASAFAHFGEEAPLVGTEGSGTIFFSYCNLRCLFCQNYDISHLAEGKDVKPSELSKIMLSLEKNGCHNINLVTPTHFVPQIIEALRIAIKQGLSIPLIFNCGGYESEEVLTLLDGIIDIYMPDTKFASFKNAELFCRASDYFPNLKKVLKIMYQQVGDLVVSQGIAQKGLLIRHLVMPDDLADTAEIMEFIAKEISTDTYINIMDQYRSCGEADQYIQIARSITQEEHARAVEIARSFGLNRFG